jgi:tetratricopeptide (TPR) repeat protein
MSLTKNIPSVILLILLAVVLVLLPSVVHEPLMYATQSGKILFFLWALLVISPAAAIVYISVTSPRHFVFTRLDLIVSAWFVYLIADGIIRRTPWSLSLTEFASLALFYVVLRLIPLKNFKWLFFAFIIGGIIQAVYGNLQLWGYYPSHHNLFILTGSFFNPGPYAGYLAVVFPVALGFYFFSLRVREFERSGSFEEFEGLTRFKGSIWFEEVRSRSKSFDGISVILGRLTGKNRSDTKHSNLSICEDLIFVIAITTLLFILLVLPASRSRAAWLAVLGASVYLFATKYKKSFAGRLNKSAVRKYTVIFLMVIFLLSGFTAMYFMKKGSADGRMLIWKVTAKMISDHPVTGTGFNGFKANYMDYQSRYFENNTDPEEARVAGDTNYAFNELLQQTAEHGLTGTVLLVLVFITAFSVSKSEIKSDSVTSNHSITHSTVIISKALLLSFLIISMFSYTVQILPIKAGMVLALACLSGNSREISLGMQAGRITIITAKTVVAGATLATFCFGTRFLKEQTKALKDWKTAFTLYSMGAYEQSISKYEKALPVLWHNGDFLTNYGKALSIAGKHDEAIEILQEAAKHYPNTVIYTALGDSYKATGENIKAETSYLHAWHMNPARFYPKYLLAKLYGETGQKVKAAKVAKELLEKEVKVESTAIEEIQAEMRKILDK